MDGADDRRLSQLNAMAATDARVGAPPLASYLPLWQPILGRLHPRDLENIAITCRLLNDACRLAAQKRRSDLSLGAEPFPVIIDAGPGRQYLPSAEYISECIGDDERLRAAATAGCNCERCTDPQLCQCLCFAGALPYDADGRLRSLEDGIERPIIECGKNCRCSTSCGNRVVGNGVRAALCVFWTADGRGWGVRSVNPMRRGSFVCEYAGELISSAEAAERRRNAPDAASHNHYILSAIEHVGSPQRALRTIIDPTLKGNVGRYINHSCEPNLVTQIVRVGSFIPRLAFFCNRDIAAGEELAFHYGGGAGGGTKACRCGSQSCTGWLPFDPSADD